MKLISGWRKVYKMWSVRISAIATIIWAYLLASPDTMLTVLNQLPSDMREVLPPMLPLGVFVLVTIARLIQQEKLNG